MLLRGGRGCQAKFSIRVICWVYINSRGNRLVAEKEHEFENLA
jgi:hypothetical protein